MEEATGKDLEGELEEMTKVLKEEKVKCPECGASDWTNVRNLNLMFKTEMNGYYGDVYLRPGAQRVRLPAHSAAPRARHRPAEPGGSGLADGGQH